MELIVDVSVDGQTESVTVGTDLAVSSDVMRVAALAGADGLRTLTKGGWDARTAEAVVYVNLIRAISDGEPDWVHPPFRFADMRVDWEELTPWLNPDTETESELADNSEVLT